LSENVFFLNQVNRNDEGMMMNKCEKEGCLNEGIEVRDYSYGPLGGYSFYCKNHVEEADLLDSVNRSERNLAYLKSVAKQAFVAQEEAGKKVIEARRHVLEAEIELATKRAAS
jgi:hypothetical protein